MSLPFHPFVWTRLAACRGLDPELFCVTYRPGWRDTVADAKAVCGVCPVVDECRTWACTTSPDPVPHCVAGGLTPAERPRRPRRRPDAPCGTEQGYHGHRRRHEPQCQVCRDAHAIHWRQSVRRTS